MNARIAPPPIWPGPVDVERAHGHGRQRRARRGTRAPCARRRASTRRTSSAPRRPSRSSRPAPRCTLNACVPKTSLVEKSTNRSSVSCVASAASSTLYVPIMFTRIVRTGLSRTVSTPAIAAQWTKCVAPRASSVDGVARRGRRPGAKREVRVLGEVGPGERVAVEVVERDDLVRVDELARERRGDEAGAAGDEDPLALQSHGSRALALRAHAWTDLGGLARRRGGHRRGVRRRAPGGSSCAAPPSRRRARDGSRSAATARSRARRCCEQLVDERRSSSAWRCSTTRSRSPRRSGAAARGARTGAAARAASRRRGATSARSRSRGASRATTASGACSTSATRSRSPRTSPASSRSAPRSSSASTSPRPRCRA